MVNICLFQYMFNTFNPWCSCVCRFSKKSTSPLLHFTSISMWALLHFFSKHIEAIICFKDIRHLYTYCSWWIPLFKQKTPAFGKTQRFHGSQANTWMLEIFKYRNMCWALLAWKDLNWWNSNIILERQKKENRCFSIVLNHPSTWKDGIFQKKSNGTSNLQFSKVMCWFEGRSRVVPKII